MIASADRQFSYRFHRFLIVCRSIFFFLRIMIIRTLLTLTMQITPTGVRMPEPCGRIFGSIEALRSYVSVIFEVNV